MFTDAAIDAVRADLPFWCGWSHLLFEALIAFAAVSLVAAGNRRCLRRALDGEVWTERARWATAARSYTAAALLIVGTTAVTVSVLLHGALSLVPTWGVATVVTASVLFAYARAVHHEAKTLRAGPRTFDVTLRDLLAWATLLYPHALVALLLALAVPAELDAAGVTWLVAGTVLMALVGTGHGETLARWLGLVQPAGPRLRELAAAAARETGVTPRAVRELRWSRVNAFALPWRQTVLVTHRALEVLSDDELTGILRHELGHLTESRTVRRIRTLSILLVVPLASWRPIVHVGGWIAYLVVFALVLQTWVLLKRLWLRLEARADETAVRCGDESAYARALRRAYEENLTPAVRSRSGKLHPDLPERLEAAGVAPDFERPAPPPSGPPAVAFALACVVAITLYSGLQGMRWWLASTGVDGAEAAIALFGGGETEVQWRGYHLKQAGERRRAIAHYRAAAVLAPEKPEHPAVLAMLFVEDGKLAAAELALAEAQARRHLRPTAWREAIVEDARLVLEHARAGE